MEKINQKSPIGSALEHVKQKRCSSGAYDLSTDSSYDVTGHSHLPKWLLWCWKYDIHLNPIHFSRPGIFFMAAATSLLFYRLWPCLTSLWRHRSIKYGQGVSLDNIMWCLLTAVWIFTIRPLVREIHQAVLWLVNIDPSYDVTGLQNMLSWPSLGRFYDIYACLTPFY